MDLRDTVRRHGDLLLAVTVAVLYAAEVARYPHADHAIAVPLAVVAGLTLALRRRLPVVTFVVVTCANVGVVAFADGFDSESIMFVAVFLFNLYSLGRHARGIEAWLGVAGVGLSVAGFVLGDGAHNASDVFFAMAFCGTPWGAGVAVRLRRERERELTRTNEDLRRDREEQARRAVADERARIARELHDVVSHAISVSVLQARGGRRLVGRDDDAVRRALDAIEQTNTQALGDMRRLLSLLNETDDADVTAGARDEPQPSLARLDALLDQVRRSGLPVELDISGEARPVSPGVDLSAYRIVQEALTNVLKHAGHGASATVRVGYGPDELDIAVHNTSPHPVGAPDGRGGHGLIGMRERVGVAGGALEAGPCEQGYVVRARLPYAVDA